MSRKPKYEGKILDAKLPQVRVTSEELSEIRQFAADSGLSVSDYIRMIIFSRSTKRTYIPVELVQIVNQLSIIGGRLHEYEKNDEITDIISEIKDTVINISNILKHTFKNNTENADTQ